MEATDMHFRITFGGINSTPVQNLYDWCCDYIETAHYPSGEMNANEKVYNDCVDYVNGLSNTKQSVINNLKAFFKL